MTKTMSELKVGESATILNLRADLHLRRRLLELGLTDGETVKILSISPLKNSFLLSVKNYTLALRKNILDDIIVETI